MGKWVRRKGQRGDSPPLGDMEWEGQDDGFGSEKGRALGFSVSEAELEEEADEDELVRVLGEEEGEGEGEACHLG